MTSLVLRLMVGATIMAMALRVLALNWRDIASPQAGGAEVYLHEVLRRLVDKGHEATLLSSHFATGSSPSGDVIDDVAIHRTGRWWTAHRAIPKFAGELLKASKFDVVLDDVNKIPFFAPRWSSVPVLSLFMHLLDRSAFMEANPLSATYVWLKERQIQRVYGRTRGVAVSESTKAELVAGGYEASLLSIVPPGLDHDLYNTPDLGHDTEECLRTPVLLVVSRLQRYKRVDVAVEAAKLISEQIPEAQLVIVGDGPARSKLEAQASDLGARIQFMGLLPQEEKVRLLRTASLVLNPSYKEGWGMVGIEAMACGTPVIASDVVGHRDSVPKEAGVLVPYGDSRSMADACIRLLSNPSLYDEMRAGGLEWAQRFSWEKTAMALERELTTAVGMSASTT